MMDLVRVWKLPSTQVRKVDMTLKERLAIEKFLRAAEDGLDLDSMFYSERALAIRWLRSILNDPAIRKQVKVA